MWAFGRGTISAVSSFFLVGSFLLLTVFLQPSINYNSKFIGVYTLLLGSADKGRLLLWCNHSIGDRCLD